MTHKWTRKWTLEWLLGWSKIFFVIAVFSITVVPKVILTDQELCDSIDLQIYCSIDNPGFWEYITIKWNSNLNTVQYLQYDNLYDNVIGCLNRLEFLIIK